MQTLIGKNVYLRPLEPEDLMLLHSIENNEEFWEISNTITPYSKFILKQYLENSYKDIFEVKQLRLVICKTNKEAIGLIDIFDFDAKNMRAGVGILINKEEEKKKGQGFEALQLLCNYCFTHLQLHQLYCNISQDNDASIRLFSKAGFKKIGIKKDWISIQGEYKDESLFQLIHTKK